MMNLLKEKICIVAGAYPKYLIGGAGLQLYFLAKEFVKLGYEVHFSTFDYGQSTDDITVDEGIIIHKVKYSIPFLGFLFSLWQVLKDSDAEIYLNRGFGYTMATFLFAKSHGKKFVYSVSSSKGCIPCKISGLNPYSFLETLRYRVNQIGMCKADRIIVQAEYQRELLDKNFNLNSIIVRNGHPAPTKLSQKENPPIVLWLASLKRLKQAELFIELARQCENLDCRFILAGRPSNKGYLEELLEQMEGLPNIKYVGEITFEESNELIGHASVFVNMSKYEGFPNTFIQAWMRETPTVSLNVDPDDVIKKKKLGFHSGSFEQIVKDVKFLIRNREVREEMGRNARKYAVKEHDIKKVVPKYIELFESLKR